MYGTRPVALNWQRCYTKLLTDNGFKVTKACTCIMRHEQRDVDLMVHGDGFLTVGAQEYLLWSKGILGPKFELSTVLAGHQEGDERQVLNRIIMAVECGFSYEADARHAGLIVRDLGLQNAKPVTTPAVDQFHEDDEPLDHDTNKKYQSVCARAKFLSILRYDIQLTAKECCRAISRPTQGDYMKRKRLGRYLSGKPRLVYHYPFQEEVHRITTYTDASWASNTNHRKSTSGGVILHGLHLIESWSQTQSLVKFHRRSQNYTVDLGLQPKYCGFDQCCKA